MAKIKAQCGKCSGNGYIGAFSHYAEGRCFCCNGSGAVFVDAESNEHHKAAEFGRSLRQYRMTADEVREYALETPFWRENPQYLDVIVEAAGR